MSSTTSTRSGPSPLCPPSAAGTTHRWSSLPYSRFYSHFPASDVIGRGIRTIHDVPVLGLYKVPQGGRIVTFGDSNCLDGAHQQRNCHWLLFELLHFATTANLPFFPASRTVRDSVHLQEPSRLHGSALYQQAFCWSLVMFEHDVFPIPQVTCCTTILMFSMKLVQ